MELIDAFDTAYAEWDRLVHEVGTEQWHSATPCAEWSVRDLVNHVTGEHLWAPHLLRGATLAEVGDRFEGDVLGDQPVAAWEAAGAPSHEAFHAPGALEGQVHVTGGREASDAYGWQMTTDLAVHAWDLASGIGRSAVIPETLANDLLERVRPMIGKDGIPGIFDPPVDVAATATPQEHVLSLLGRRP
ncbi:hypothetical protein N566_01525 [Streptomycetaceae bacterium MP113-05]|nr:hypothetical protein N566_01525 [Streptomycetaceae bacterium MP113-05]